MQQPKNYTSANRCERNAALAIYVGLWNQAHPIFHLSTGADKNSIEYFTESRMAEWLEREFTFLGILFRIGCR
jgi:hypothetical protein